MNFLDSIKQEFIKAVSHLTGEDFAASSDIPTAEPSTSGDTGTTTTLSANEVSLSDKVLGSKVETINSDGSLSVAPDGNYNVDGFCFSVKDGLISAIQGQSEPIDENMAQDAAPEPNPEIEALKAEIATLQQTVASIVSSLSGMSENFASKADTATKEDVKNFEAVVVTLNDNMLKLAKLPAEPSKTNTKVEVKNSDDEKLKAFASAFSNAKK